MQLINKYNKGIRYLLCVVDLFSIVEGLKKILDDSNRKLNKIWVDHGSEFYNNKFKSFLKRNYIEIQLLQRDLLKLLKKIYKHMTATDKNVYFNVLDDIVDKYSNTVHGSTKMKPKDVTDEYFVEYSGETNKKDPNFKV